MEHRLGALTWLRAAPALAQAHTGMSKVELTAFEAFPEPRMVEELQITPNKKARGRGRGPGGIGARAGLGGSLQLELRQCFML